MIVCHRILPPSVTLSSMPTAPIVPGTAKKDDTTAYASVAVSEGDSRTEFNVSTPLLDADGNEKSAARLKSDLADDLNRQIEAQTVATSPLSGVSGSLPLS
jgi:hypothetical protein